MHDIPEDKRLPNGQVRQTTAGRLRADGYDVFPSCWFGHATLRFPGLPTEEDWDRLQKAFMPREKNPYPRAA